MLGGKTRQDQGAERGIGAQGHQEKPSDRSQKRHLDRSLNEVWEQAMQRSAEKYTGTGYQCKGTDASRVAGIFTKARMAEVKWAGYVVVDEQPDQTANGQQHEKLGLNFESSGKPLENFDQGSSMM